MDNKASNRRRQIVINKALQSRIIFATVWAPGLCLAITSLLLGVFCARLSSEALAADVELPSVLPIFITSVCFMLIASGYMLYGALKFSHRIAGPMYHIDRVMREVRRGKTSARVNLRTNDYLKELAADVNNFLDWLEMAAPELKHEEEEVQAGQEQVEEQEQQQQHPSIDEVPAPLIESEQQAQKQQQQEQAKA